MDQVGSSKPRFQYQQIAEEIELRILRGDLRSGERLPPERVLGTEFNVQRNTIRQALALLESKGSVATKGRRGSFVLAAGSPVKEGVVLVNIGVGSGPNGAALFDGVATGAVTLGLEVQRTSTEPLPKSAMNRVPDPNALPAEVAGVILWPHHPSDTSMLQMLCKSLPVVLVDHRVTGVSIDCVRFDDVNGGKMVTEHLLGLGHRRIAFLTDEVWADSVQARWQGYVLAHELAGLPCDHRLSLLYQFIDPKILALTLRHLISEPQIRPTAVVCSNDLVAFTLLRVLSLEGLRVPDDMAVTGYGNAMPEYMNAISLTTVDQPFYRMGLEAVRVLGERIRQSQEDRLRSHLDICLPVELVSRGST